MSYDDVQTAAVIRYPYLWARQARAGETEGRKDRPVAVGVRIPRTDGDFVLFFPITSKEPEKSRFSAEIPAIEKRRASHVLRRIDAMKMNRACFLMIYGRILASLGSGVQRLR